MSYIKSPTAPLPGTKSDSMFPTLTSEQLARVELHGRVRRVRTGEVLSEAGVESALFFVVKTGQIEVVQVSGDAQELVATCGAGQFTGEISLLSGRRTLVRHRASEPGEIIQLDRGQLLALVQVDSELSELFMRAFILRRVELIARGVGAVVLVGSSHSAGTLRLREFLTRNGHPYTSVDVERDQAVQELFDRFQVAVEDVPIVICHGSQVLRNPSNQELADCLGFNEAIDRSQIRELVIVGAGPAGLAAAVYGASEELMSLWWKPMPLEDRLVQVRESRITSVFRMAYPGRISRHAPSYRHRSSEPRFLSQDPCHGCYARERSTPWKWTMVRTFRRVA